MDGIGNIDRRALLVAGIATPFAIGAASAHSNPPAARPDLTLDRRGADEWRWCSWQHDGECWRPVRGTVRGAGAGSLAVTGPLPAQDRAEIVALLREAMPGRAVAFTPER